MVGDIRLVDGVSLGEGRLEVCINGSWSTVCDNEFDLDDATVVCRQLGLGDGKLVIRTYNVAELIIKCVSIQRRTYGR